MGITHHSNYIRFMEEARLDFMEQVGWGYDKMEEEGVISPVKFQFCYTMTVAGKTVCTATLLSSNSPPTDLANARNNTVFPVPGTSSKSTCPPHRKLTATFSITASLIINTLEAPHAHRPVFPPKVQNPFACSSRRFWKYRAFQIPC